MNNQRYNCEDSCNNKCNKEKLNNCKKSCGKNDIIPPIPITSIIIATGPTDTYDYFFNKINRNYYSTKNIHHIKL